MSNGRFSAVEYLADQVEQDGFTAHTFRRVTATARHNGYTRIAALLQQARRELDRRERAAIDEAKEAP